MVFIWFFPICYKVLATQFLHLSIGQQVYLLYDLSPFRDVCGRKIGRKFVSRFDEVCWWRTQRGIGMHLSNYTNVPAQVNHNRSTKLRAAPQPETPPSAGPSLPSLFLSPFLFLSARCVKTRIAGQLCLATHASSCEVCGSRFLPPIAVRNSWNWPPADCPTCTLSGVQFLL